MTILLLGGPSMFTGGPSPNPYQPSPSVNSNRILKSPYETHILYSFSDLPHLRRYRGSKYARRKSSAGSPSHGRPARSWG